VACRARHWVRIARPGNARERGAHAAIAADPDPAGADWRDEVSGEEANRAPDGKPVPGSGATPREVARVPLPTPAGEFEARALACPSGFVYLALLKGDLGDGGPVLTRLHSECLVGDALGSLRCDCGVQLRTSLGTIASEGRGLLLYATGQEGRGIGLINKFRAYALQETGLDTLDANRHLGLAADARDYQEAAACLSVLGIPSVRLLTNNPHKAASLRSAGIDVEEIIALPTSPHIRNADYLRTKQRRMGHTAPTGPEPPAVAGEALDVRALLGSISTHAARPHVVLKYAQTLDGRIATRTGDSKWISGEAERRVSHALRAACDAVLVGVGTVIADDPQLTVRLVAGSSPIRIVLDSTLRLPSNAKVLDGGACTILATTERSSVERRRELRARGVGVRVVGPDPPWGVSLAGTLAVLREAGVRSLLVEGGAAVITSFLRARLVDRVVAGITPTILGAGTEAVGDLSIARVSEGLRLTRRAVHALGDDLVVAGDVG
jgi:3,4-dihydroxy 2-butanone 4-phosphate synthase/GTP cyclohydrolase II